MAVFFLRGCDLALACLPRLGPAEGGGVVSEFGIWAVVVRIQGLVG